MKNQAFLVLLLLLSLPKIINLNCYRHRKKGFTLLEVVLVCTILGFTLATVFPLYSFGVHAFSAGIERSDLQQNVRLGVDFCTKELYFAEYIQILDNGSRVQYSKPFDNNHYMLQRKGSELVVFINNIENKVSYNIRDFSAKLEQEEQLLHFTIVGEDGKEGFKIRSAVFIRNL